METLDVLILMDEPAYPGCLVTCRVLGVLTADQADRRGKAVRNDRIIAVAPCSILFRGIRKIEELNANMGKEIEIFFIDCNRHAGKRFKPLKFSGVKTALRTIQKAIV